MILPQSDTSDNVIYIWMPVGVSQVGHASLSLSNDEYVSWWPQGRTAKCGFKQKISQYDCSLQDDIREEDMDPDYIFNIPSTQLDLAKMTAFWNKQKSTGHYSLLDQNCCWVVYHVLHAGGAPMSQTILWRPETLRRYLVIYLGGGSSFRAYLNMPSFDSPFKEKIIVYGWDARDETESHYSILLDYSVYVSWWPRRSSSSEHAASSLEGDRRNIGREEDKKYIFPAELLEYHLMRRRWKQMMGNDLSQMWGVSSECVIKTILAAGGARPMRIIGIMRPFWESSTRSKYHPHSIDHYH